MALITQDELSMMMPPTAVIDPSLPFQIRLKFRTGGYNAAAMATLPALQGTVHFYYEGYGSQPEGEFLPTVTVHINAPTSVTGTVHEYEVTTASLPAAALPAGAYRLVATVTFPAPWNWFGVVESYLALKA